MCMVGGRSWTTTSASAQVLAAAGAYQARQWLGSPASSTCAEALDVVLDATDHTHTHPMLRHGQPCPSLGYVCVWLVASRTTSTASAQVLEAAAASQARQWLGS